MNNINVSRLQNFAVVAREGRLVRAAQVLGTTHSNLSVQIRALEDELGGQLFERRGRRLVLTALGAEVSWYADEVSRLAREVAELAQGGAPQPRRMPFRVGVVGAIPKALAFRLLEPALQTGGYGPVVARQDTFERLLEELATGKLHLVLADHPPQQGGPLKVFGHLLGSTEIYLYATRALAKRVSGPLPTSLAGLPLLLPARGTAVRRAIEKWLGERGVRTQVEGEFDDVGLMRVFGLRGAGVFPVRAALRAEVEDMGDVVCLGQVPDVMERYYAISVERRVRHPAVSALIDFARARLDQKDPAPDSGKNR